MHGWMRDPLSLRCWLLPVSAIFVFACSAAEVKTTFCESVSSSPGCPNDTKGCVEAVSITETKFPHCQPIYDALLECITPLPKACQGSTITAVGDGYIAAAYGTYPGAVFDVEVKDTKCVQHIASAYSCQQCSALQADITEPFVAPIGGLCDDVVGCATGLTCLSGVCTKSCTTTQDCERCSDLNHQICHAGTCRVSCSAQGATCDHLPANYSCNGYEEPGSLYYVCEPH